MIFKIADRYEQCTPPTRIDRPYTYVNNGRYTCCTPRNIQKYSIKILAIGTVEFALCKMVFGVYKVRFFVSFTLFVLFV